MKTGILKNGSSLVLALAFAVASMLLGLKVDDGQFLIYLSVVMCLALVGLAYFMLEAKVKFGMVADIGFLYCVIVSLYTIVPGISFIFFDLSELRGFTWQTLITLQATNIGIGQHMMRHVLFLSMFVLSYVALYPGNSATQPAGEYESRFGGLSGQLTDRIVVVSLFLIGLILVVVVVSSGSVDSYIDHYTRFSHLGYFERKLMSVFLRIKAGLVFCVFPVMFLNYRRYKYIIGILACSLMVFEVVYSSGSRIEAFFLVLYILCLYILLVKRLSLSRIFLFASILVLVFSFLEMLRSAEFHFGDVVANFEKNSFSPAAEFCSVFSTGYHLYEERNSNQLAEAEWPMFFNDFIMLVMPNDFTRYSPQYWYASIFYPDSAVPPQTNGPISDSAIWGGVFDLAIRGLLNGAVFSLILRTFIRNSAKWWSYAMYAFCYSTSVMVVKYSVFYHLNPLLKTVFPAVVVLDLYLRKVMAQSTKHQKSLVNQKLLDRFSNSSRETV